jgi:hypothetical protein
VDSLKTSYDVVWQPFEKAFASMAFFGKAKRERK